MTWPLRPLLLWINRIANRLVSASGVEPVEKAAAGGQDADTIREIVARSRAAGTLEEQFSGPIAQAIALGSLTVRGIVQTERPPTAVPTTATVADVREVAGRSGHLRVLVGTGADCRVVHVRDTLALPDDTPVTQVARDALSLTGDTSATEALTRMRRARVQLATVVEGERLLGVVTLDDLLREIVPSSAGPAGALPA
ncbi:CBS domain-containing protein [Leucobacter rhizosphaerae]|uniref:CBS domain-containing protein n=1 Tax=Leucobacter rhizosphaerae TaxID=2932245 RepID=UPI003D273E5E